MKQTVDNHTIVYGLNPAFETVLAGRRRVYRANLGKQGLRNPRLKKFADLCRERGIPVKVHEKGRLIHLGGSRDHQGVVLETAPYPYERFDTVVNTADRLLLLDNIEDPQNVGAILRSAEVLGYDTVLLPRRGVPGIYASVLKASAGAAEHLKIVREMNATQYVKKLPPETWQIIALDADGEVSADHYTPEAAAKILLVIGGENKGVHQFILNHAHTRLSIPRQGRINSLNASVAAALAMYTLRKKPEPNPNTNV